jgi:predicted O-methyltransferase YrrM
MEQFRHRPLQQPLLFNSITEETFNLDAFLQPLISSFTLDSSPKKRKYTEREKEDKEIELETEKRKEKEKEKETEKERVLLFSVKKIGTIVIQSSDCNLQTIPITNESHILYNRVAFYTYIKQYLDEFSEKIEIQTSQTCESMKQQTQFTLLAHQQLVRKYMNVHTPYRGLLLYHGLGSGKTCSSIAIAENMKNYKKIIVMCPASLKTNYIKELKFCGDPEYNASLHCWKRIDYHDSRYESVVKQLCIPLKRYEPVWVTEPSEPPNYSTLTTAQQQSVQLFIEQLILTKYTFIHYNGLSETSKAWKQLLRDEKEIGNPFHNKVIIVDEAHNLISRIVNKMESKKEQIAIKLYNWLKTGENCKIILLTGTPIINSSYEIAILYNILRGTSKVFTFDNKQSKGSETVYNQQQSNPLISNVDLVDTTNPNQFIITKCPHGFTMKKNKMELTLSEEYTSTSAEQLEKEFKENIEKSLQCKFTGVKQYDALPENKEDFEKLFVENSENLNMLMRRISGLTSYFPDMETLMPTLYPPEIIQIPMSEIHYQYYWEKRLKELESEKKSRKLKPDEEGANNYKINSRLACNFAFPIDIERPQISIEKEITNFDVFNTEDYQKDSSETQKELQTLQRCYAQVKQFFYKNQELVAEYSPKFHSIATNIVSINSISKPKLHLVYSQFLTIEGLNLFAIMLQLPKYGEYVAFDIVKDQDKWTIPSTIKSAQNKYVLYTGAMEPEKREIIRNIFNKDMANVPVELHEFISTMTPITVFMITSAGAEGISLKCVQHVHIMEPYWNPVRIDQVIGRARRICSHASLPKEEQYVKVYKYIMVFGDVKKGKKGKKDETTTTDEFLMEHSMKKDNVIRTFQNYIQDSAIDCFLHKTTCFSLPLSDPNSLLFNYNSNMEKDKSLAKLDDTYIKYKKSLDEVSKLIDNQYIYDMFYSWSFKLHGKTVDFDSNINSYEACFIAQLIRIYAKEYKKDTLPLSIVEIGLARGTSALIIINELLKFPSSYIAIDPNQTSQWDNIGRKNIEQFLHIMKRSDYPITIMEESSTTGMPSLLASNTKLHISFIDGSHEENIVLQDIENSDKLLVKDGIMILDDVKHKGVKEAVIKYMTNNEHYRRVSIQRNLYKTETKLYDKDSSKESATNPNTMYCFQKLNE